MADKHKKERNEMKKLLVVIAAAVSGSAFALSEAAQFEQLEERVAKLEKKIAKLEVSPSASVGSSANVPSKDYKVALGRISAIQFSIDNKRLADDDFAELSEASKAVYMEEFGGLTNDLAAAKKALAELEATMAPDELSKVKKYEEAHREIRQVRDSGFRKRMKERVKEKAEELAAKIKQKEAEAKKTSKLRSHSIRPRITQPTSEKPAK